MIMEEALISCVITSFKYEACILFGKLKEQRVVAYASGEMFRNGIHLKMGRKVRINLEQGRYVIRDINCW